MTRVNNSLSYLNAITCFIFGLFLGMGFISETRHESFSLLLLFVGILCIAGCSTIAFSYLKYPSLYLNNETLFIKRVVGQEYSFPVKDIILIEQVYDFYLPALKPWTKYKFRLVFRINGNEKEIIFYNYFSNEKMTRFIELVRRENPFLRTSNL